MTTFEKNRLEVLEFLAAKTERVGMIPVGMIRTARALLHLKILKADPAMGWDLTEAGKVQLERLRKLKEVNHD